MREALITFRNRLTPELLQHGAHIDSQYFWDLDAREGRDYEHGLARLFDSFFGVDHIHLDRRLDSPRYEVINGLHRILVAQLLGWTEIPACVSGGTDF